MKRFVRAGVALAGAAGLAWLGACSDEPGGPGSVRLSLPEGVIVSDPVPAAALREAARTALALAPGAADDVAYVSLAPGTVLTGARASVRRVGDADSITTTVIDGGFDPIPVIAQAGDSIEVIVTDAAGAVVLQQIVLVAAARRPIIVRTDPPPRKRDVPLNASVVIVFSEPMDAGTLNVSSVQLLRGTTTVVGTVSLLPGSATAAVFTPDAALDANTDYQLIVTQAVRDLDGDALESGVTVEFTTGTALGANGQIAFASDRYGGHPEIYVMNADGSRLHILTYNGVGGLDYAPAWSPDGTRIAFLTSGICGNGGISVMNADGFGVTQLVVTFCPPSAYYHSPVWSPDGSKIAYTKFIYSTSQCPFPGEPSCRTFRPPPPHRWILVQNADGSGLTQLTFTGWDSMPSWSPDGMRIAFESTRDGNADIYVMNADGSAQVNLTNNSGSDGGPVWSPEGTRIAFSSDRDGNPEIYAMDADGSVQVNLTNNPGRDGGPVWSPDGTRIAFSSDRDGHREIYVMNADGSGLQKLTSNGGGWFDYAPVWSRDGTRIAFVSNRDGNSEIYVMNTDGSGQVNLTNNPGYDYGPAWRPR